MSTTASSRSSSATTASARYFGTATEIDQQYDVFVGGVPGGVQLPALASWVLNPIVVPVGAVPVVVVPVVDVVVRIDKVGLPIQVGTSVSSNLQFEAGADFQNGNWTPYTEQSLDFGANNPSFELIAGGQVRANVGPKLSLMVYGLAGPAIHAGPYLLVDADDDQKIWSLFGGLGARLLANFGGFSKKLKFPAAIEIADTKKLLTSGGYPQTSSDTDAPSGLGACCTVDEAPGCGETAVESCVCAQDVYCCDTAWDQLCVDQVESLGCGTCG